MTLLSSHRGWDQPSDDERLPRWRRLLPAEVLSSTAQSRPNAEAVRSAGRHVSWAELDSLADKAGNALLARGFRPGDVVGVHAGNVLETLALMYGMGRAGIVQLPLNPRATAAEVDYQMRAAEAVALVGPSGIDIHELLGSGHSGAPDVDVQETDPLQVRFSAGTTGVPKMFYFRQRSLALLHQHIATELSYAADDVLLVNAPIAHAAFHLTAAAVSVGATLVVQPQFEPDTVWRDCDEESVTQLFMVPTMVAMALDAPGIGSSIRGIAVSASAFPDAVKRRVIDRFAHASVTELYGASELGFVTMLRSEEWEGHPGSVGLPRFGYRVRVLKPDGSDCAPGEIGDIYVQGPAMSEGYIGDVAGALPVRDGWVSAADMGWRDEDGFLYIADRRSDLIITGGNNVYPAEVENVLLEVPGVREAAVVGVPDPVWGAMVLAVVTGDSTPDALDLHCRERLAKYKVPRSYRFLSELPKTPTGKILRRDLRERFAAGETVSVHGPVTEQK